MGSLWRFSALLVSLALCSACSGISGTLRAPLPGSAGKGFRVGAAKVDITPMPGFPMAGHSVAGKVARGHWTRLHARVIYLEDDAGRSMVLVSCDLLGIPGGLGDRVTELVRSHPGGQHIGREQLVLAATHTHHGPGAFFTSETYNGFGSRYEGFDRRLFEFLAHQIARGILDAAARSSPALLRVGDTIVPALARNRSFGAFLLNPEAAEILRDNAALPVGEPSPAYPEVDAFRAVDPRMTVLRFVSAADGARTIAIAAFVAVHATAMSHRTEVYSSDLFGIAATLVEGKLGSQGSGPVVAIFNGAEGDVSPYWTWGRQDRGDAVRLGRLVADELMRLPLGTPVRADLDYRFKIVTIPGQCLEVIARDGPWADRKRCTADKPIAGAAGLGGAEDGRTVFYDLGWKEGVKGPRKQDGHGPKQPALDPSFLPFSTGSFITQLFVRPGSFPREVPLGVYRLGDVLLATLPGEFTSVMGRRIVADVKASLKGAGIGATRVLLIGPANEYLSYTTTPEEYEMQDYEGASTVYGPITGPLVAEKLAELARGLSDQKGPFEERTFSYDPGKSREFGLADVGGASPHFPDDGLANVVQDLVSGRPRRDFPFHCWNDGVPRFPGPSSTDARLTPSVAVETSGDQVTWVPVVIDGVEETDNGMGFVTVVVGQSASGSRWCATWVQPGEVKGRGKFRFKVQTIDPAFGPVVFSAPF
jgi:neutral ceramidase